MADIRQILANINAVLWNETWIFIIAGTGVVFTVWSGFAQYRALTHGAKVLRGGYDDPGIHSICVDPRDSKNIALGISCGGVWNRNTPFSRESSAVRMSRSFAIVE